MIGQEGSAKNPVPKQTKITFISVVCCLVIAFAKREGSIEALSSWTNVQLVGGMLLRIFIYCCENDSTLRGGALSV